MEKHGRSIIDILHFEITQEEAMEMSREDGYEAGFAKGAEAERERINRLNQMLIEHNRFEDLKKSAADAEFQAELFEAFGI